MCVLGSEEKKAEDLNGLEDALKVEMQKERFDDQVHGRMSARADIEDEKARKNMEEIQVSAGVLLKALLKEPRIGSF